MWHGQAMIRRNGVLPTHVIGELFGEDESSSRVVDELFDYSN